MNLINYRKFDLNFQGKTIRQKDEGPKKGTEEELKKEEQQGSLVVPSETAAVTANADELIMYYIKGVMNMDKVVNKAGETMEPKEGDAGKI